MSDTTDLIRAVDERHVREVIAVHEGGEEAWCPVCSEHWPCEVRRVRDALEAQQEAYKRLNDASNDVIRMMADKWQETEDERDEYREGINWGTSCLSCARTLTACYQAECERDDALRWAEWFMAAYDYTVRHADLFGYGDFRVTTWAYKQALTALEKHRTRADEANAAIQVAIEIADQYATSEYHRFYDMVEILDAYLKEVEA